MTRILIVVFVLCVTAMPAYAYIDVAIGSLILQALAGGFFAFLVIWRQWIEMIKNFFRGKGFTLDELPEEHSAANGETLEANAEIQNTKT